MNHYSPERKESVLRKLLPPHNRTVTEVSEQEGISTATLYNWRTQAKIGGVPVPGHSKSSDDWSVFVSKDVASIDHAALDS
jgi:transposase